MAIRKKISNLVIDNFVSPVDGTEQIELTQTVGPTKISGSTDIDTISTYVNSNAPVQSVNGEVGTVILNAADVVETSGIVTTMIADDNITLAKMAHTAAGSIITFDATTAPSYVAPGTATHLLTTNGPGLVPSWQVNSAKNFAIENIGDVTIANQQFVDFVPINNAIYYRVDMEFDSLRFNTPTTLFVQIYNSSFVLHTAANYIWEVTNKRPGVPELIEASGGSTQMQLHVSTSPVGPLGYADGEFSMHSIGNTTDRKLFFYRGLMLNNTTTITEMVNERGWLENTTAIGGIRLGVLAGLMTSGRVRFRGYRNI